jgi:hypothetical protein
MCNISACERNVMNITEVESVLHSPNLHGLHLQQIDQISLSPRSALEVYLTRRTVTSGGPSGRANRSSRADLGTDSTLAGQPSSFAQGLSLLLKVYFDHTIG